MFCKNCGTEFKENGRFCPNCGTDNGGQIDHVSNSSLKETTLLNSNMAPIMSIWSYVGLFILGAIPIAGTIAIIIFAIDTSNKNRSNYCRAIIVLWLIGALAMLLFGASIAGILSSL